MIAATELFSREMPVRNGVLLGVDTSEEANQMQTKDAFSDKWKTMVQGAPQAVTGMYESQFKWYLELYGFHSEAELASFLKSKKTILDAGCGLGYKAAWFARLNPSATVIGMDISDSIFDAKKQFGDLPNLFFVKGDISNTGIKPGTIDYISCDQVIHHTDNPPKTFQHLSSLLTKGGEFACYVYSKKALPRELLDEYFRENVSNYKPEDVWALSRQLTELGKTLSDLNIKITVPEIPLFNIKGGEYDLQRFLYWNFFKCYWNESLGYDASVAVNFDWYAPSNAFRYSEEEFKKIVSDNQLNTVFFHKEEACYSGRFKK